MSVFVRPGTGGYNTAANMYVKVGGVWRFVIGVAVKVGGVWRSAY